MMELIVSRRTVIWLLLVAATAFSWQMGHGVGFNDFRYASCSIIFLAMVKIRYVILEFMELRYAPVPLRIGAEAWVAAVCCALIVLYWNSAGIQ